MNTPRRTPLKLTAIALAALLTFTACGAGTTSPLVTALEAITVAADVGAPVVAILSPSTASFVSLIPGIATAALDVAEGTSPASTATAVVAQLQQTFQQGQALLPGLSATDKAVVSGILAAIQQGISLFSKQFGVTATAQSQALRQAYAMGFLDVPGATGKVKAAKLSKADKAALKRARAHVAAVKDALAKRAVK